MASRNTRRGGTSARKPATPSTTPANTPPASTEKQELPDPAVDPSQGGSQAATGDSGADTPAPPLSDAPDAPVSDADPLEPAPQGQPDPIAKKEGDDDENENVTNQTLDDNKFRQAWFEYLKKGNYVPPKGHILFPGEPLTYRGQTIRGSVVVVSEDVYRMVIPFRSKRPTFTLVAREGQIVPKAGFIPKDDYEDVTRDLYRELVGDDE